MAAPKYAKIWYIIINVASEGICFEFDKKNMNTALVFLLSNCPQILNYLILILTISVYDY